jgi:spore coat polysaccharide biosynthesis predicted glycosyltransferase SpsG
MIVIRTDSLPRRGQGQTSRTVYLASLLNKYSPVIFCLSDSSADLLNRQKNRLSCASFKQIYDMGNESIKGIVFDLSRFSQEDIDLINWTKEKHLISVQITDLGLNQQPVDFTIDASISPIVPYNKDKRGLFGPDFCILHHKYRHFNRKRKFQKKRIRNLFLHLEDCLNYRQTRMLVDILSRNGFWLKINLGPWQKKSHKKTLKRIYPGIRFIGQIESFARVFYESDVALVKAGESAFGVAACGTPSLYLCSGNEQEFAAETFEKKGVGLKISSQSPDFIGKVLEKLNLLDHELRKNMGTCGKEMVDARGIYRVIDFFMEKNMIRGERCLKSD